MRATVYGCVSLLDISVYVCKCICMSLLSYACIDIWLRGYILCVCCVLYVPLMYVCAFMAVCVCVCVCVHAPFEVSHKVDSGGTGRLAVDKYSDSKSSACERERGLHRHHVTAIRQTSNNRQAEEDLSRTGTYRTLLVNTSMENHWKTSLRTLPSQSDKVLFCKDLD